MSTKTGDEFTRATKRKMAERVGWKCSFSGCGKNTIGPDSGDPGRSINNGIAAHICGAKPGSARYRSEMRPDERRHIRNGIWMCRDHANLIDADDAPYSPATLRAWKLAAESRAAESLKSPTADLLPEESTLIQLGSRIVVHATWDRASHNKWSFALIRPEIGDFDKLKEYVLTLSVLPENESYVVVESEGDARRINTACLGRSQSGQQVLELGVQDKLPPTDPNRYGSSFKLGEDGDLAVEQGGIAMVRGIEAAKQHIMCAMGVIKGEIRWDEEVGSLASEYFSKYRNNVGLLSRLMKLELIRLSLIPVASRFRRNEHRPSLHFVKRFVSVSIASTELAYSRLRVSVELEWGNGEYWAGDIPIFVLQNDA